MGYFSAFLCMNVWLKIKIFIVLYIFYCIYSHIHNKIENATFGIFAHNDIKMPKSSPFSKKMFSHNIFWLFSKVWPLWCEYENLKDLTKEEFQKADNKNFEQTLKFISENKVVERMDEMMNPPKNPPSSSVSLKVVAMNHAHNWYIFFFINKIKSRLSSSALSLTKVGDPPLEILLILELFNEWELFSGSTAFAEDDNS